MRLPDPAPLSCKLALNIENYDFNFWRGKSRVERTLRARSATQSHKIFRAKSRNHDFRYFSANLRDRGTVRQPKSRTSISSRRAMGYFHHPKMQGKFPGIVLLFRVRKMLVKS